MVGTNEIDPYLGNNDNKRNLYAFGVWNENTSFSADLGQVVWVTVKNVNVLGATFSINSNNKQGKNLILLPTQEQEFIFSTFDNEPTDWKFDVSTESDAFIILYKIESTWVPGMHRNRLK